MNNAEILDIRFDGEQLQIDSRASIPRKYLSKEVIRDIMQFRENYIRGTFVGTDNDIFIQTRVDILDNEYGHPIVRFHKFATNINE